MIKIYYNTKSTADLEVKLTLKGTFFKGEVYQEDLDLRGYDVIDNLESYRTHIMVRSDMGKNKIFREMTLADFKLLDICRLGLDNHFDFATIIQLYSDADIFQIDTGMISGDTRDIVIRVFECNPEKLVIDCDEEYKLLKFNSDDLVLDAHPRFSLWDKYGLEINNKRYKANDKGIYLEGDPSVPLTSENDYIDITIKKFKGDDFATELTRDIDNEEVFVDSSAGMVNNKRVRLVNGVGNFRLYKLGYTGPFKLKLGRKWYRVWNDYSFIMG